MVAGAEEKEENVFSVNLVAVRSCDSLFSLALLNQVTLTNLEFLKAFNASFPGTTLLDPSLQKSIYQVLHQYKVIIC